MGETQNNNIKETSSSEGDIPNPNINNDSPAPPKLAILLTYSNAKNDTQNFETWDYHKAIEEIKDNGETSIIKWKCNTNKVKENDEIFLMKLGDDVNNKSDSSIFKGKKGIIAHGYAKSEKNDDKKIKVLFDIVLKENEILPLELLNSISNCVSKQPGDTSNKTFGWTPQSSGIKIPNEVFLKLKELWKKHLDDLGLIHLNQEEVTMDANTGNSNTQIKDLNIILYGPPGTGKTYHTAHLAVAICDNDLEAFNEIINPEIPKDTNDEEVQGSITNATDNTEEESQDSANNRKEIPNVFDSYKELMKQGRIAFTTFHQSYGYEEFIEGIKPVLSKTARRGRNNRRSGEISYELADGVFKEFCERARDDKDNNYVFIIDEINRGNIAKIFGELITLIEDTKREGKPEAATAILPYSKESFSVPSNVYVIGTMNTADRSIMQLDTALRRRFRFVEMMPEPSLLKDINIYDEKQADKGINLALMLETMNKRIEALYDREHTIGHSYFMKLNENSKIKDLAEIFKKDILPLLQEYFYEDYEKIQLVLGDNAKKEESGKFIKDETINFGNIFKGDKKDLEIELLSKKYSVNTAPYGEYKFYEYLQDELDKGNNDENRES